LQGFTVYSKLLGDIKKAAPAPTAAPAAVPVTAFNAGAAAAAVTAAAVTAAPVPIVPALQPVDGSEGKLEQLQADLCSPASACSAVEVEDGWLCV
jgi:hypothetical protein